MTAVSQHYCAQCGASYSDNSAFCVSCGIRLSAPAAASQPPVVIYPMSIPPMPSQNVGTNQPQMPAPAQNWQVVVGDHLPVMARQPPGVPAVVPQPAPALARSLSGSVVKTAMAACTDLAAAYATANPTAIATANYRIGFAGISLIAGLIAGRRRGIASIIVMLGTLGLSLLEGMTLWGFVGQIQASPQLLQGLLPNAIPQALTMLMSLGTAFSAIRRS
jgi:hypothetical protein